jgi:hypothetical protein
MKVVVPASQLGTLVGLNKHKPLHTGFETLWKKSHPVSYYNAMHRNNIITDDERLQRIHGLPLTTIETPQNAWQARKGLSAICKEISRSDSVLDAEKSFVKRYMKKCVYTTYGNAAEKALFDHVHKNFHPLIDSEHILGPTPLFTTPSGVSCLLCGKPDALTTDQTHVVELKNRIHRLLCKGGGNVPTHEYLQCLAYLHLVPRARNCHLIESITTKKRRMVCHVVEIERDPGFWNTIVLPRLWNVVTLLATVVGDSHLQDVYMTDGRNSLSSFHRFMRRTTESLPRWPPTPT